MRQLIYDLCWVTSGFRTTTDSSAVVYRAPFEETKLSLSSCLDLICAGGTYEFDLMYSYRTIASFRAKADYGRVKVSIYIDGQLREKVGMNK